MFGNGNTFGVRQGARSHLCNFFWGLCIERLFTLLFEKRFGKFISKKRDKWCWEPNRNVNSRDMRRRWDKRKPQDYLSVGEKGRASGFWQVPSPSEMVLWIFWGSSKIWRHRTCEKGTIWISVAIFRIFRCRQKVYLCAVHKLNVPNLTRSLFFGHFFPSEKSHSWQRWTFRFLTGRSLCA
jgi:hypothetical protein